MWSCQPREDNHYRARISNFYEILVEKQNFEEITQGKIKIIGNITSTITNTTTKDSTHTLQIQMHQGKDKRMKGTKPATDRKRDRRKRSIKIATWNVQAKASHLGDIEIIASDMRNRGISICCIQETQNSSDEVSSWDTMIT